ncbi:hypothetical protein PsorP6_012830 [Peronosclerospora sorghi]|uniref:Uncharacterized protein n=1 Tax=Peronosclerospora sorghi TaxID=230839 RepID=A0ACC0WGN3_9STRA|nr:hypothetical protein PsorP6_012830 [Peronosclerospora sorghi]
MEHNRTQQFVDNMAQMLAQQQDIINQLLQQRTFSGLRVEVLKLPTYSGRLEESVHLFFDQMGQYFTARGTDWQDATFATRILAILGVRFAVQPHNADLQQRLRDDINNLRQKDCKNLVDYIAIFRHLNLQLKGMNEIDKIVYFQRGLRQATKEEVQYRRCATLAEAITVALDFKRAHPYQRRYDPQRFQSRSTYFNEPEPIEIDSDEPFHPINVLKDQVVLTETTTGRGSFVDTAKRLVMKSTIVSR